MRVVCSVMDGYRNATASINHYAYLELDTHGYVTRRDATRDARPNACFVELQWRGYHFVLLVAVEEISMEEPEVRDTRMQAAYAPACNPDACRLMCCMPSHIS